MIQDDNLPDKCNYHGGKAVILLAIQTKHLNYTIFIALISLYNKLAKLYMHVVWKHMSE